LVHPDFIALNVCRLMIRVICIYQLTGLSLNIIVVLTPQLQYPCITIKQIRVNTET